MVFVIWVHVVKDCPMARTKPWEVSNKFWDKVSPLILKQHVRECANGKVAAHADVPAGVIPVCLDHFERHCRMLTAYLASAGM